MNKNNIAVLLLAYGSPDSLNDVPAYLKNIKAGHSEHGAADPTQEEIDKLEKRYTAIGGISPFNEITQKQASDLEKSLNANGINAKVYVGMKFWKPTITESVKSMKEDNVKRAIVLPMAPYYSSVSTEGYRKEMLSAMKSQGFNPEIDFIESWNTNERFIKAWTSSIEVAIARSGVLVTDVALLFTTHSLPARAAEKDGDIYQEQFMRTATAIAKELSAKEWFTAYQSASGKDWLGPDVKERATDLSKKGYKAIVIAPIGFLAENLETMYDIDIECVEPLSKWGVNVVRAGLPNSNPLFIDALASIVREHTK
ncbi:MAG: ferrochelatase [Candidatus Marsarchaeota archaeon]|nr:ferrochelatase [Candidatus Marsarchaeota archaeon]